MHLLDKYTYTNQLRDVHPMEKGLFSLVTLGAALFFQSPWVHLFIFCSFSLLIVWAARIPTSFYLGYLSFPLPFVVLSIVTIVVNFSRDHTAFDYFLHTFFFYVGTTDGALIHGLHIFLRTFACISCLYFLSLTTPMVDIAWMLRRLKVPAIFVELMTIIYRFIFVLLETAVIIKTSQECRLGYASLKRAYLSLGQLIANLFIKALQNYRYQVLAMESRLYAGELKVLETVKTVSITNIIFMAIYFLILFNAGFWL
jgi:cobalt/nickel transport system permease protein